MFVMAEWNAETNACPNADSFMVELRIDVLQDVKAMTEPKHRHGGGDDGQVARRH